MVLDTKQYYTIHHKIITIVGNLVFDRNVNLDMAQTDAQISDTPWVEFDHNAKN